MCRHNRKVAEEFRRQDLIQCWTLAEMIASPISTEFESSDVDDPHVPAPSTAADTRPVQCAPPAPPAAPHSRG